MKKQLTKSSIASRTGWSKSLVEKLLGSPDEIKKIRVHGISVMAHFYDEEKVIAAELSKQFSDAQESLQKHKNAARKATETKISNLLNEVEAMTINVDKYSIDTIIKKAIHSYNDWNRESENYASKSSDEIFLERITVNYIRHNMTQYDKNLEHVAGKTGSFIAVKLIREKIYSAISSEYPSLAEECNRQLERRNQEYIR